ELWIDRIRAHRLDRDASLMPFDNLFSGSQPSGPLLNTLFAREVFHNQEVPGLPPVILSSNNTQIHLSFTSYWCGMFNKPMYLVEMVVCVCGEEAVSMSGEL